MSRAAGGGGIIGRTQGRRAAGDVPSVGAGRAPPGVAAWPPDPKETGTVGKATPAIMFDHYTQGPFRRKYLFCWGLTERRLR